MRSLPTLLTWIAVPALAIMFALPVARVLGTRGPYALRVALWFGFGGLTAVIMSVSLVRPMVSFGATAIVVVIPIVIAATTILLLGRGFLSQGWHAIPRWLLAGCIFLSLFLVIGTTLAPSHYDFSLYHYSAIKWAAEHGTVTGLANFSTYLGYSNSAIPWAAWLLNGFAGERGYSTFVGLWAVALLIDLLLRWSEGRRSPGLYVAAGNIFVCITPLLVFADVLVASPTSDSVVFVLALVSLASLADCVAKPHRLRTDLVLVLSPLLIASSMRPQILILFAACVAVLVVTTVRARARVDRSGLIGSISVVAVLGFLLGILSLARDYRLSGWAVYPLSLVSFDVPWRVEDPDGLRAITIGIARDPGPAYQQAAQDFSWLVPWMQRQWLSWEIWFALILITGGVALLAIARIRGASLRIMTLLLVIFPCIIYAITWILILPPTWRHAWGPIFGVGSVLIGWGLWRLRARPGRWAALVLSTAVVVGVISLLIRYPSKPTEIQDRATIEVETESGLILLAPVNGDQCGVAPLLCTPMPRKDLRLIGDGPDSGFVRTPSGTGK